jgi:hypothetical protein
MSNGNDDWATDKKKREAVYKVLKYLSENPEEGLKRVGKDDEARKLFEDKGEIGVPVERGARVIFFATGEQALNVGASVILEVPPKMLDATDDQLENFILGNYTYWPPNRR